MRVKECMCKKVVRATSDTTLNEVAKLMQENDVGCVPICNEDDSVIGFVTDRDIVTRCVANKVNCAETKVSDIMTRNIIKTTPDTTIEDATQTMSTNQIRRLPVIENNQIVGMLTIGDLAQHQDVQAQKIGDTIECICECQNK